MVATALVAHAAAALVLLWFLYRTLTQECGQCMLWHLLLLLLRQQCFADSFVGRSCCNADGQARIAMYVHLSFMFVGCWTAVCVL